MRGLRNIPPSDCDYPPLWENGTLKASAKTQTEDPWRQRLLGFLAATLARAARSVPGPTGDGTMKQPTGKPAKALAALEPFVGVWDMTGTILNARGQPEGELTAVDAYEWSPGGFFLLHHVDGLMGESVVKALGVIGAGQREGVCVARSYDNAGQSDQFEVALNGRDWTIDGETQRFRGQLSADLRTLEGQWEMTEQGSTWRPWMRIRLGKRIAGPQR
jgi:hypothetical protein